MLQPQVKSPLPSVAFTTAQAVGPSATHNVALPAVKVGQLCIVQTSMAAGNTRTALPSGWSVLGSLASTILTLYKIIDGTEGGVCQVTYAAGTANAGYIITVLDGMNPDIAGAFGTLAGSDPPALTIPWGTNKHSVCLVGLFTQGTSIDPSGTPTGYTLSGYQHITSSNLSVGSFYKLAGQVASEDPGVVSTTGAPTTVLTNTFAFAGLNPGP